MTPMSVVVGTDFETGDAIRISDTARRSGLYVLGRPGTGKTSLLTTIIEADIHNGHGVFFLDPHGDGIDLLLTRLCTVRSNDGTPVIDPAPHIRVIDPTDNHYSFGINLLACRDLSDRSARRDTYNKAHHVFRTLWQLEWDQRPWLRLIVQYTLLAFIENPGYTLAEVPVFLDPANVAFREHIVSNIKANTEAAHFWRTHFDTKREWDQQRQVDAALSRVRELLGDPDVKSIIGQSVTTVDFPGLIENRSVLLVKLPPSLPYDSKRFIGTILVSELLHAIYARDAVPSERRHQFCVFVDEFQHFCAWDDFTALFTEGRKYGIATTIAHQERYGQFSDNKAIIGATDAAANKLLFQLSVRDAEALAPEFAEEPTAADARHEAQLVVSQTPFADLLRGHTNPHIRHFVSRYLRPLQERWEAIPDEIGRLRMLRQSLIDQSGSSRIDERMYSLLRPDRVYDIRHQALAQAQSALQRADAYTGNILGLYERSQGYRGMIRYLDAFLTGLMEGRIRPGQEAFSQFLIDRVQEASRVPPAFQATLRLYLSLTYGDPTVPPPVPTAFAQTHGLLPQVLRSLEEQHRALIEQRVATYREEFWTNSDRERDVAIEKADGYKRGFVASIRHNLDEFKRFLDIFAKDHYDEYHIDDLIGVFVWLLAWPPLEKLMSSYYSGCFGPPWADDLATPETIITRLMDRVAALRQLDPQFKRKRGWFAKTSSDTMNNEAHFRPQVFDALEQFLHRHEEGAIVVLTLLQTIRNPLRWGRWMGDAELIGYRASETMSSRYSVLVEGYKEYPGFNMLWLPSLATTEPLRVALLVDTVAAMRSNWNAADACENFYYRADAWGVYKNASQGSPEAKLKAHIANPSARIIDHVSKHDGLADIRAIIEASPMGSAFFKMIVDIYAAHPINRQLVEDYLLCHILDMYRFDETIVDMTFPLPNIHAMAGGVYRALLMGILPALETRKLAEDTARDDEWYTSQQRSCDDGTEYVKKSVLIPDTLPAVRLTSNDIDAIRRACLEEFSRGEREGWDAKTTLAVIDEFVEFCTLLAKSENHIRTPSGQYTEKAINVSTYADMANGMAQRLMRLPRFNAYAKLIEYSEKEAAGRKIITPEPPPLPEWRHALEEGGALGGTGVSWTKRLFSIFAMKTYLAGVCKERLEVDKEIRERRQRWDGATKPAQPPAAKEKEKPDTPPSEEPPPSYVSNKGPSTFRPKPR
jgi:hypothetical protein